MKRINSWMPYLYTAYIAYLEFYSSIICGNETKLMQKRPNIMFLIPTTFSLSHETWVRCFVQDSLAGKWPLSNITCIQFRWLEIICFQQNPFQKQIWNLEAMFLGLPPKFNYYLKPFKHDFIEEPSIDVMNNIQQTSWH